MSCVMLQQPSSLKETVLLLRAAAKGREKLLAAIYSNYESIILKRKPYPLPLHLAFLS